MVVLVMIKYLLILKYFLLQDESMNLTVVLTLDLLTKT
jgi:hypothetical protein